MLKNKKLWIAAGVLVMVTLTAWLRIRAAQAGSQIRFETTAAAKGRIIAKVTATGTLSAIVTVQVGSQVSGTIAALHADWNSQVTKGQLVAKIDPALFEAAVQQARANLVAAQGNLAKARAQAVDARRLEKRDKELLARNLIAQADYDTAQATADADDAAVDAAVGAVEQAKAALNQADVNLAYTNITSPTEGTVVARNVDVGQTVAASLQAPVLFLIAQDLKKMQVDTSVAEADIGKIQPAMRATFTVDAYTGERFVGKVRQVRINPQTVQNVVTYDAVIDVANPDLKLMPGMTANCTFVYAERPDVLRVPNAAIRFVPPPQLLARLGAGAKGGAGHHGEDTAEAASPSTGSSATASAAPGSRSPRPESAPGAGPADRKTVWLVRNDKPVAVTIRTGVSDGSQTEVVEGDLKEGDLVVTDVTLGAAARGTQGTAGGVFPRRLF